MATGLARMRAPRPLLWALVVGLVLGVLALHHLAAHHGAADLDHPGYAHDAEPAAGGDAGLTSIGSSEASLSSMRSGASGPTISSPAPLDADEDTGGPTAATLAVLPAAPSPGALGDLAAIWLAVLGSLALAIAASVLRALSTATRPDVGARPRCPSLLTRAPPTSVPIRLAQLQVLRL